MLRVRLRKPGKLIKGRYHFKIVVVEQKAARESRFVEQVGYYDPSRNMLKFSPDAYKEWVGKGAQPSDTVATLFKRYVKQIEKQGKELGCEICVGAQSKAKPKPKAEAKPQQQASEPEQAATETAPAQEQPAEQPQENETEKPQEQEPEPEKKSE